MAVVTAALRRLGTPLPASVLVVGVGAQGLLMSLALLDRSVDVHVRDVNPDRVAFAVQLGATAAAPDQDERASTSSSTPSARRRPSRLRSEASRSAERCCSLGSTTARSAVTAQTIVRRQAVVRGSLTYDHPADFEAAIRIVAERRFGPGRIVSDEYPLADAQARLRSQPVGTGKDVDPDRGRKS